MVGVILQSLASYCGGGGGGGFGASTGSPSGMVIMFGWYIGCPLMLAWCPVTGRAVMLRVGDG